MRLVCPSCDAEYEIARTAIPRSGREVECSNCGHGWFQAFTDLRIDEAALNAPDDRPEATPPTDPPRPMDDAVLDVLRQEAAREVQARLAEAGQSGLETQTEMPLAPTGGGADHLQSLKAAAELPSASVPPRPRRDLLPAIDEVDAALNQSPAAQVPTTAAEALPKIQPSPFVRAVLFVILIGAIALALYVFAPLIAQKVPSLAQTCADYVAAVDRGLHWTQDHLRRAVGWVQSVWRHLAG